MNRKIDKIIAEHFKNSRYFYYFSSSNTCFVVVQFKLIMQQCKLSCNDKYLNRK